MMLLVPFIRKQSHLSANKKSKVTQKIFSDIVRMFNTLTTYIIFLELLLTFFLLECLTLMSPSGSVGSASDSYSVGP